MSSYISPSNYGFEYLRWWSPDCGSDAYGKHCRNVFGGAVTVHNICIRNDSSNPVYVKLYDSLVEYVDGSTVALQIPLFIIPVRSGKGYSIPFPNGYSFTTGVTVRAVQGAADSSSTDPSGGLLSISILGKK